MSRQPRRFGFIVVTTLFAWAAIIVAVAVSWPIYESPHFVIMVAATLVVGSAIAITGAIFRLAAPVLLLATLAAYLLLGVPLAVPDKAVAGILPTLDGIIELVQMTALGWKQLLTITLPVGTYQGLLVPVFVLLLIVIVVTLSIAIRVRFGELAVVGPVALLLAGLALGPQKAPLALPLTLSLLVVGLIWLGWARWFRRRESVLQLQTTLGGDTKPLISAERSGGMRAIASAAAVLTIAVTLGTGATQFAGPENPRVVPRDRIEQPFDPRDYVSPLIGLRLFHQSSHALETLMTATGLPDGARIRIATLDSYDGVVFAVGSPQVVSESGAFVRVPTALDQSAITGTPARITITIDGYEGVWLPTVGMLESVDFAGDRSARLLDSFFANASSGTAIVIDGVTRGDSYELDTIVTTPPRTGTVTGLVPGTAIVPAASGVPEEVGVVLDGWVRGADTPGARLEAMLAALADEGYISHGVDNDEVPSRSGHGADRIAELLTAKPMVGDQEQYAVVAALMARAIGFPSRVVYGFAPEHGSSGTVAVTGSDVTAWIEVDTLRNGWVAIDPTPPVRDIPEVDDEEAAQVSRPLTPIPPAEITPETQQDRVPLANTPDEEVVEDPLMAVLLTALAWLGGILLIVALILSPFIAIVAAKARRRHLRRTAPTPAGRISGGWREFEDAVVDRGLTPPASPTRSEVAEVVGGLKPLILASVADRAVFAPEQVDPIEATQVWGAVRDLTESLSDGLTRRQKLAALVSLRSLGGYSVAELLTGKGSPP